MTAEAVPGDNFWSSGLSKDQIPWTRASNWPGRNIMGTLHMELREQLKNHELPSQREVR